MNEERFPDKEFFWGIVNTIIPEWTQAYTEKVVANRHVMKPHNFDETKTIKVSDRWL